jgi:hypothetical protein
METQIGITRAAAADNRQLLGVPRHQPVTFGPSTSGWNEILRSNPNHLAVVSFVAISAGTVNVYLGTGTSAQDAQPFPTAAALSPAIALSTNGGFSWSTSWPSYLFETDPGVGLWMHLDGNVQVSGYLTFVIIARQQGAS